MDSQESFWRDSPWVFMAPAMAGALALWLYAQITDLDLQFVNGIAVGVILLAVALVQPRLRRRRERREEQDPGDP